MAGIHCTYLFILNTVQSKNVMKFDENISSHFVTFLSEETSLKLPLMFLVWGFAKK